LLDVLKPPAGLPSYLTAAIDWTAAIRWHWTGRTATSMKTTTYEQARERMDALQAEAAAERVARRTRKAASPSGAWDFVQRILFRARGPRVTVGA
jgi:hypothetical protein